MATYGFQIKAGDTAKTLTVQAKDGNDQLVLLTNITGVVFKMWPQTNPTAAFTVNAAGSFATMNDRRTGLPFTALSYAWAPGDTAVPGAYWGEFEVTYGNGKVDSFPTPGWFPILVDQDR